MATGEALGLKKVLWETIAGGEPLWDPGTGGAGVGRERSGETVGCTQAAAPIPRSSGWKATGSSRRFLK